MKHRQQQQQQQQRVFAARKHCARLAVAWTDEDDALLAGRRCTIDPVMTTVNQHNVHTLHEIFPTTDHDVLQDVLIAADFQVDVAATMLFDLVSASTAVAPLPQETVVVTVSERTAGAASTALDFEMTSVDDDGDDDDWAVVQPHKQSPEATEAHPWILVHNEWEVVGMDGESVETFADKLRRAGANAPLAASPLPLLSVVATTPTRALQRATTKKVAVSDAAMHECSEQRSVKSFGVRKRRFMKTRS